MPRPNRKQVFTELDRLYRATERYPLVDWAVEQEIIRQGHGILFSWRATITKEMTDFQVKLFTQKLEKTVWWPYLIYKGGQNGRTKSIRVSGL